MIAVNGFGIDRRSVVRRRSKHIVCCTRRSRYLTVDNVAIFFCKTGTRSPEPGAVADKEYVTAVSGFANRVRVGRGGSETITQSHQATGCHRTTRWEKGATASTSRWRLPVLRSRERVSTTACRHDRQDAARCWRDRDRSIATRMATFALPTRCDASWPNCERPSSAGLPDGQRQQRGQV